MQDATNSASQNAYKPAHTLGDEDDDDALDHDSHVGSTQLGDDNGIDVPKPAPVHYPLGTEQVVFFSRSGTWLALPV